MVLCSCEHLNKVVLLSIETISFHFFAEINCGPLPNPEKGVVSFQSTEFLSIARYSCNNGYILMGSPERECMANGKWSGSEPICSGEFAVSQ